MRKNKRKQRKVQESESKPLRTELGINLAMFQEPPASLEIAQWSPDVVCPAEWQRRAAVVMNLLHTSMSDVLPAPALSKKYYISTQVQSDGIVTVHLRCDWQDRTPFLLAYSDHQAHNTQFTKVFAESLSLERCMLYLMNETVPGADDEGYWNSTATGWEQLSPISARHFHSFVEEVLGHINVMPTASHLQQQNLRMLRL